MYNWANQNKYTVNPYVRIELGRYNEQQLSILGIRPNALSAVKLPNGTKATLFSGPNFDGESYTLTQSSDCLVNSSSWNDKARSLIFENSV